MVRLGALLRRSRDKSEQKPEADKPVGPVFQGPPIIVMIPDVAGVSSFRISSFPHADAAVEYISSLSRQQRSRALAFWALQEELSGAVDGEDPGGEAMVLIRSAEGSDLVYIVSFLDIESAQSFARFEVKRGMHLGLILVYWASMVNVVVSDEGVQLIPEFPPNVNANGLRHRAAETRKAKREPHTRSEVRQLQAEADEEKKRLQAELNEMEKLRAEAEELKRLQAEAAQKRRLQAEVEERRRVLKAELDEVKRLRAEAEVKRKELTAQAEENARDGEEARKWLRAEAEEKKRLQAETVEMKRLQAELEETRRLGTEAAAKRQLQLEQELEERYRTEEEAQRLQAEAETQLRLAEAAEEQARLQAELQEIEQRRIELLQRQRPEGLAGAQHAIETPENRETDAGPIEPLPFKAETGEYEPPDATAQKPLAIDGELAAQRRFEAEAEERRGLEADAQQRRFEAEAEERRRLEAEAEQRRLEAEAEQRRLEAEAEQRRFEAEAEQRRLEAQAEQRRRLEAESAEQRRLVADAEEQRRVEPEEQRRLEQESELRRSEAEAEAAEQGRLEAETEQRRRGLEAEQRRREAEAEELRRLKAAAEEQSRLEEQLRLEAEAEEQRRFEAERAALFGRADAGLGGPNEPQSPSGDERKADTPPQQPADGPNPIEELLRREAESRVDVPSHYAREPVEPVVEPESEPEISDEDAESISDEVSRILRKRRWTKRESPFEGFKSPPGRF